MAVTKRGQWYHYRFKCGGTLYTGVCLDDDGNKCMQKRDAEKYERGQRQFVQDLRAQKTDAAVVENYRETLAGGKTVALAEAWDTFCGKPRRRPMGERHAAMVRGRWENFLAFMQDQYPDVTELKSVKREHAEAFIGHIRAKGQWVPRDMENLARKLNWSVPAVQRAITLGKRYPKTGEERDRLAYLREQREKRIRKWGRRAAQPYTPHAEKLSAAAQNNYLTTCKSVFSALADDAGIYDAPFARIAKVENVPEEREAFSPEELKLIGQNARGWVYSLFMVATNTGLREGDVCTLRWAEVDLGAGWIRRKMLKTGKVVEIPILPALAKHLCSLPRENGFVFPDLAERYEKQRTSVGAQVTRFLEGLGIETTRKVSGRSRAVSVKDIHSCRHTFCYLAALNGVPLPVVQSVVGHMTPEMTKRYMDHASQEAKRKALSVVPDYIAAVPIDVQRVDGEPERLRLKELADALPLEEVRRVLASLCQ